MLYVLKKVEVNGNADMYGGRDGETDIAISADVNKLVDYCEKNFNFKPLWGEKPVKFEWTYYIILKSDLILL